MANDFLQFNPNGNNELTQVDYDANGVRTGGIVPGIALKEIYNKLFKQCSTMSAAIGELADDLGLNALDDNLTDLKNNLKIAFRNDAIFNSKGYNPNDFVGNTRRIFDYLDADDWVAQSSTTVSTVTSGALVGGKAVKIEETDNAGSFISAKLNSISLDLSVLNNGEVVANGDFYVFPVTVSDATKFDFAFGLRLNFSDQATFDDANHERFSVTTGIVTGLNFLKVKKQDLATIGGGADLSNIQSLSIVARTTASAIGESITAHYADIEKADPIDPNIPNPFQKNSERVGELKSGEYYIGLENGINKILNVAPTTDDDSILLQDQFENGIFEISQIVDTGLDAPGLAWLGSTTMTFDVLGNNIRIREGAVTVASIPFVVPNAGDKVTIKVNKQGLDITVTATLNDYVNSQPLKYTTAIAGSGAIGIRSFVNQKLEILSFSTTELQHCDTANRANVAGSLEAQPYVYAQFGAGQTQTLTTPNPEDVTYEDVQEGSEWFDGTTFTAPSNGLYEISPQTTFDSSTLGYRQLIIRNVTASTNYSQPNQPPVTGTQTTLESNITRRLSKGDQILIQARQTTGGNLGLTSGVTNHVSIRKVAG